MKKYIFLIILLVFPSLVISTGILNANVFIKSIMGFLFIDLISLIIFINLIINKNVIKVVLNTTDLILLFLLLSIIISLGNNHHLYPIITSIIYYVAVRLYLIDNNTEFNSILEKLILASPYIVCLNIIIIILQQLSLFPPLHKFFNNGSTFGNPDMLANYLSILVPFCFMRGRKSKWLFGFVVGILALVLFVYIQARSALFSLFLCLLLWLIMEKRINRKQIILSVVLIFFLLYGLVYLQPLSVVGRFFIWQMSVGMILKRPFGWGTNAFEKWLPEYQVSYFTSHPDTTGAMTSDIVHSPFNEFLNIGVTFGVFILFLYICLNFSVLRNALMYKSRLIYPLLIFTLLSLTYFIFKITPIILLMVPMVAAVSGSNKIQSAGFLFVKIRKPFLVIVIVASVFGISNTVTSYINFKKWQKAVVYSQNKENRQEAEKLFNFLYPKMIDNGRFLITFSNLKYVQGDNVLAIKLLEKADKCFCDIILATKMAGLYYELGFLEKAEEKFTLAENIAPDRFLSSYEKVLFYRRTKQDKKAYDLCKEIIKRPIKEQVFADPFIIKAKARRMISAYEKELNVFDGN